VLRVANDVGLPGSTGIAADASFPGVTPRDRELLGLPFLVSNAVADGELHLIDAEQFAADSDAITVQTSRQGALAMADDAVGRRSKSGQSVAGQCDSIAPATRTYASQNAITAFCSALIPGNISAAAAAFSPP
jgi:hypothetical protein